MNECAFNTRVTACTIDSIPLRQGSVSSLSIILCPLDGDWSSWNQSRSMHWFHKYSPVETGVLDRLFPLFGHVTIFHVFERSLYVQQIW